MPVSSSASVPGVPCCFRATPVPERRAGRWPCWEMTSCLHVPASQTRVLHCNAILTLTRPAAQPKARATRAPASGRSDADIALALMFTHTAALVNAATRTWTGSCGTDNWSNENNWDRVNNVATDIAPGDELFCCSKRSHELGQQLFGLAGQQAGVRHPRGAIYYFRKLLHHYRVINNWKRQYSSNQAEQHRQR